MQHNGIKGVEVRACHLALSFRQKEGPHTGKRVRLCILKRAREVPPLRRVTHHFCLPNSFCQNPAGSWIPQCHLWLLCDPALYSNRHPCPYHQLDWKWKRCECCVFGEDLVVVNFKIEPIFVELPWSLSLIPLYHFFFFSFPLSML